jgi:hypothetical protein
LNEAEIKEVMCIYSLQLASPDMLPRKLRAGLGAAEAETIAELERVCEMARRLGRAPNENELTHTMKVALKRLDTRRVTALRHIGLLRLPITEAATPPNAPMPSAIPTRRPRAV